jgi:hypothetical protein
MVSIIKSYVNLIIKHVHIETACTCPFWDTYNWDNNKAACKLIIQLLGPQHF